MNLSRLAKWSVHNTSGCCSLTEKDVFQGPVWEQALQKRAGPYIRWPSSCDSFTSFEVSLLLLVAGKPSSFDERRKILPVLLSTTVHSFVTWYIVVFQLPPQMRDSASPNEADQLANMTSFLSVLCFFLPLPHAKLLFRIRSLQEKVTTSSVAK